MTKFTCLLAAALLLGTTASWAQSTPQRIRGTIEQLEGHTLTVRAAGGDSDRIVLADGYTVGAIVPATLDQVKPGMKIGIVGFGPPERQRAAVVSIFPEGATVNEAQFPWDTQKDSVMTNAPVTSDVVTSDGRMLTVTVKGQKVEVMVPAAAVIQASEPGTPAMLTKGAKVLIFAQKAADGGLSAARVNVGKDGYTPAN